MCHCAMAHGPPLGHRNGPLTIHTNIISNEKEFKELLIFVFVKWVKIRNRKIASKYFV